MTPTIATTPSRAAAAAEGLRDERLAAALGAHGVRRGDKVAVLAPADARSIVSRACWRLGAVVVVMDPTMTQNERRTACRLSRPHAVIGDELGLWPARRLASTALRLSLDPLPPLHRTVLKVDGDLATIVAEPSPPAPRTSIHPEDDAAIVFAGDPERVVTGVHYTHEELAQIAQALTAWSRVDAMEPELFGRLSRQGTRFTAAQLVVPGLALDEPAPAVAPDPVHRRVRDPLRA